METKTGINIHEEVRKFCPDNAGVYFSQSLSTITVILDSDIGKDKRSQLQSKILSFIGGRMLHDTYRTVKIVY